MHHVPELVEVGLHLVVLQQRGGVRGGLGEVGHHGRDGDLAAPILLQAARLQAKAGRVSVLPFPGGGRVSLAVGGGSTVPADRLRGLVTTQQPRFFRSLALGPSLNRLPDEANGHVEQPQL